MATQFGGPSGATSFLTGLASSTMNSFKEDSDRQKAEDYHAQMIDHDMLMRALEQVQKDDTLTPSQRTAATQEIMQRSVDIFKPKGHGGIKDNLKDLFGKGERYIPQGVGGALQKKPRLQVGTLGGGTEPSTFGMGEPDASGQRQQVTLPPPPTMPVFEKTYREMDLADKQKEVGFQFEKQRQMAEVNEQIRRRDVKLKTDEAIRRVATTLPLREQAHAERKLKEKIVELGGNSEDPDPVILQRAQLALQQESEQKSQLANQRMELQKSQITKINADITNAQTRIEQGWQRLRQSQATQSKKVFDADPQVKAGWVKVNQYKGQAQTLRTQAAIAYGKQDFERAEALNQQAEAAENEIQKTTNSIEARQQRILGVTLPAPPTGIRPSFNLKQWIADHPGASQADINAKRQKFKGYQIIE